MTSRILLADDSITIQKVVNLTFADEGIEVISVSNGEMAERRMGEINPDLVLADIFMPGKNGYELCEYIKESSEFRDVPVVLLVGAFEPFDQSEARRVRADGHLTKPFETRTLVETVRSLIEKSARPQTDSLASLPPSEDEEKESEQPLRAYEAGAIKPPPLNIDLSAMTDPWTPQEPAPPRTNEGVTTPSMDPLNESSPLDIDYSLAAPPEPDVLSFASADHQPIDTIELSSLTDDDQYTEGENMLMDIPAQSGPPAVDVQSQTDSGRLILPLSNPDVDAEENHEWEQRRTTSPLEPDFGDDDMVLDFEKVDEPESHQPENIVSFDLDSEPPVDEAGPPVGEVTTDEAHRVVASGVGSFQDEAGFGLNNDQEASYTDQAAASFTGSSLFTDEEPLGDLIGTGMDTEMSAATEAGQVFEELSGSGSSFMAPDKEFARASKEEWVDSFHISTDADRSPEATAEAVGLSSSKEPEIGFTTREMATPDKSEFTSGALLDSSSPFEFIETEAGGSGTGEVEEFKASEMWAEEEMRFTPIDVEDAPIREEAAPTEARGDQESHIEFMPSAAHSLNDSRARPADLPPDVLDEIVRRVVAEISDSVVREIAWEVVPDCVERVVEKLTRESLSKRI